MPMEWGVAVTLAITVVGGIVWAIRLEGKVQAAEKAIEKAIEGKADEKLTDERIKTLRHDLDKWERQGGERIRDLERIVGRAKVFTDAGNE